MVELNENDLTEVSGGDWGGDINKLYDQITASIENAGYQFGKFMSWVKCKLGW